MKLVFTITHVICIGLTLLIKFQMLGGDPHSWGDALFVFVLLWANVHGLVFVSAGIAGLFALSGEGWNRILTKQPKRKEK